MVKEMILRCISFQELAKDIKQNNKRILMFGAGAIGQVITPEILNSHELLDSVDCYLDNNQAMWGEKITACGRDFEIRSPQYLKECQDGTVILLNISRFSDVIEQLEGMECTKNMECYIMPMMLIHNYCSAASQGAAILSDKPLIPKKLHYMWLGRNPLPDSLKKCIDSWRKNCPDYEIIEWNEDNYDIGKHPYMKQAYDAKAYGFVPDYARLDILYNEGGLYLDTDVEIKRNIDDLLYQEAFCGVEKWQVINFGGLSGAVKNYPMVKKFLDAREDIMFLDLDGKQNRNTCGFYDTRVAIDAGYKIDGTTQNVGGMNIYAYDYFQPYDYMSGLLNETENTHSVHWFNGGWLDEKMKKINEESRNRYLELYKRATMEGDNSHGDHSPKGKAVKNIDLSNTELLFTFHDIYPDASAYDIINEIEKIDIDVGISVICELLQSLNYKVELEGYPLWIPYETVLKQEFCGIKPSSLDEFKECEYLHKDKHIISQQMLLILLKYFLIYGKHVSSKANKVCKEVYQEVINLCLMVTEECNRFIEDPAFDVNNFVYCNYHVSSSKNVAASFVRTYYMLEILNPQKDLFSDIEREYVNYNQAYTDKYGFGIMETLSVLFWELNAYIGTDNNRLKYAPIWRSIGDIYGGTPLISAANGVINLLSMELSKQGYWAKDSIDRMWDFSEFLSKPFIINEQNRYLSISEYTLKNAFFENVFWLIRDCYPQENKTAMAFYGRLFEKYIQKLSKEASSNNGNASFIDEFTFGKDNKRSSDAYIKSGKRLLIVEAKGFSILISTLIDKDIEKNNEKLFAKPILEANECFYNIRCSEDSRFDDIEEAYIVSVTMDSINAVPQYMKDILDKIYRERKETGTDEFYFNLNIDEYEMLMKHVESGDDIFEILHDYDSLAVMMPFSNYIRRKGEVSNSMTNFMNGIYKQAATEMKKLYGLGA